MLQSFRWVWQAAPRAFALTIVAQLIGAASLAAVLLCGRSVVDALTASDARATISGLLSVVAGLAGALFGSGIAVVIDREARFVLGELVVHRFQTEIVDIAGTVDYQRFEEQRFHDLLDRAGDEGAQSSMQMVYDVLALVGSALASVSLLVVLASTVPSVLPLLVLVGVPFLLAGRASARLAFQTAYDLTPNDRLRFALFGILVGPQQAKEIRVFDLHRPLRGRWNELFADRAERLGRVAARRTMLNGLASLASSALVAGLLLVVVNAAVDDQIELADAAVAIVALQQLSGRIRTTSSSAGSLREAGLFLDDFERFRSLGPPQPVATDRPEPLPAFDQLAVEQVTFRYPGTTPVVLHGVDLAIGRGEIVALVGQSGSGKTTLAHLVAGLYAPTSGRITWDGTDIATIEPARYWSSLAVVYQDYARYPLTARENIAISDHRRLDDQPAVAAAARRAEIDGVIEQLPRGYETMLNRSFESGATLSHGEWQRLAVARAFFRPAPLLVLDEPAASLDALAERQLYERLVELSRDRSVLLISHRFSTVRMAHRIYVLEGGRVTEHGTHDELMALDGHYATLFRVQAAGYVEAP